ncbi:MAG: YggS family pyridoxal phosphate-dependent enzyme [Candidatus Omnitrophota bacterium]
MSLNQRIELIKKQIIPAALKAGTNPDNVCIVCVTKYAEIEDVISVIKLGFYDIAENYLQEANRKRELLKAALSLAQFERINWHFIGHLQRNKAAEVMEFARLIQSVDSLRLAKRISEIAGKADKPANILVQVNIAEEKAKFGAAFSEVEKLLPEILKLPYLNIQGFMGIGPLFADPEDSRVGFRQLKLCFDKMNDYLSQTEYPQMSILSMGMSNDYKIALEEGSNMIRIGSAIFGG